MNQIPIEKLIHQYNSGLSTKYLAQFYNCSVSTIQRKLRKNNALKFCKKYNIDKNYFDIIDTEQKAYWLGFIFVKGEIKKNTIQINCNDENHLKKFLESIYSNHPIKRNSVIIKNKHMVEALAYKGIEEYKKFYKISNKLEKHYWRGIIDGLNTFQSKNTFKIIAEKELCELFKSFCKKIIETKANVKKGKNNYSFILHGKTAFKVINFLYRDSSIYLDRKYKRYVEWEHAYNAEIYYKVVKFFKNYFLNKKLSIKRCHMPNCLEGDCTYYDKENHWHIRIEKDLNDNEAINCLLHELSHIDTMLQEKDPHGSAFGIAYSKIYKMYEKEFLN